MRFRNSEVRFVDETDAALDFPDSGVVEYESKMNSYNEFSGGSDFE
jgi:hypothetical protein